MKRFIRYLYEYEKGRRLRNVGFVKVEQGNDECTLHIHGKGLHMKGEQKLTLYLFYEDGDECVGIWQGIVDNINPAINYRLYYTPEDVGTPENFEKINGIILVSELGHRYAAVWNDSPVDVGHMRILDLSQEAQNMQEPQKMQGIQDEAGETADDRSEEDVGLMQNPQEDATDTGNLERDAGFMPELQEESTDIESTEEEASDVDDSKGAEDHRRQQEDAPTVNPTGQETNGPQPGDVQSANEAQQSESICQCTKIQRNDIARLPRCEWKWANNSFLLHGYYNYHHLTLIDDGGRFMLGVPGIYHPQESKAASVFGFTEFIPVQELEVDLSDEEGCRQEQFGYWCRPVKRPLRM